MDPYVTLAHDTIREKLKTGKTLAVPPGLPIEMLTQRAGVFVSLHKKTDHSLRGCIGTFEPAYKNIAEEIINNAISAAFEDGRFLPLSEQEFDDLEINVDLLSQPERVTDMKTLNPKRYGLLVRNSSGRRGLLLPDIGIETVEEQIGLCCQKGGIDPTSDTVELYRFTVERHM